MIRVLLLVIALCLASALATAAEGVSSASANSSGDHLVAASGLATIESVGRHLDLHPAGQSCDTICLAAMLVAGAMPLPATRWPAVWPRRSYHTPEARVAGPDLPPPRS